MKGVEQYIIKEDTITLQVENLRLPTRRIDLEEKDLIIGKEIKGNYENWYLKILEGRNTRVGDYKMLVIERHTNKNTFGIFPSGIYPTLELCEYALFPKASDIYYFTCYAKPYFDTFQSMASFSEADEVTAKAVFADITMQLNLFLKEKSSLKNYRAIAFQNVFNEELLKNNFNPVISQKALNDILVKYHIKF